MYKFIEEMLNEKPNDMKGVAATPAADHLFKVNDAPIYLDIDRASTFHHLVAKCLFLCKRARPDIHPTVAFLTTRIQKPDIDDWKKLVRLMNYLRKTLYMTLNLEIDQLDNAVNHRIAQRNQRQIRANRQAIQQLLDKNFGWRHGAPRVGSVGLAGRREEGALDAC